jgi:hypothetical protein
VLCTLMGEVAGITTVGRGDSTIVLFVRSVCGFAAALFLTSELLHCKE